MPEKRRSEWWAWASRPLMGSANETPMYWQRRSVGLEIDPANTSRLLVPEGYSMLIKRAVCTPWVRADLANHVADFSIRVNDAATPWTGVPGQPGPAAIRGEIMEWDLSLLVPPASVVVVGIRAATNTLTTVRLWLYGELIPDEAVTT